MRLSLTIAAFLALAGIARAEGDAAEREALLAIYRINISQEICGFELSDAQSAALGGMSDKLEETLGLDEPAAQKLYDEATAALEARKPQGLCEPNGEWAKNYAETLGKLVQ